MILVGVSLGSLLAPLNSTMLAVALPSIRDDFAISHVQLAWIVSAYLIAMAVAQPIGGRIGDELGRLRVFRWALTAFLGCSILAALSPSFGVLVALRTGQAVAGAAAIPTGTAMLRGAVATDRLGRYIGINGAVISIAAAAGPLVGAALLSVGSWRLLFLVNLPVIAAALLLSRLLPPDAPRRPSFRGVIDPAGAALFATSLVALTALLARLQQLSLATAGVALLAAGALVALVLHQRRARVPVAGWYLFRRRSFAAAASVVMLTNVVMYTTLLAIPFLVEEVRGGSSGQIGLLLTAMTALMVLLGPIAGTAADRYGRRAPVLTGAVILTAAAAVLTLTIATEASLILVGGALGALGLGVGLTGPALTAAVESAPIAQAGSASGTTSMARYFGSILGAGVLAALLDAGEGGAELGLITALMAAVTFAAVTVIVAATQVHRFPPAGGEDGYAAPVHDIAVPASGGEP